MKFFRDFIKAALTEQKMVGLDIEGLVGKGIVSVGCKKVLDDDCSLAYAPLAHDDGKPVVQPVLLKKVPLIIAVIEPNEVLAQPNKFLDHAHTSNSIAVLSYQRFNRIAILFLGQANK
jgi:hypothetical protein